MSSECRFFDVNVNYSLSWKEMLLVGEIEIVLFDTAILPSTFRERGKKGERGGFVNRQVMEVRIPREMDEREVVEYMYDELGCVCADLPTFLQWAGMYSRQKESHDPFYKMTTGDLAENICEKLESCDSGGKSMDRAIFLKWVKMCRGCANNKFYYSVSTIDTPFFSGGRKCFLTYRMLRGKMTLGFTPVEKHFPVNTCFLEAKI